jgi:hypothetical protein
LQLASSQLELDLRTALWKFAKIDEDRVDNIEPGYICHGNVRFLRNKIGDFLKYMQIVNGYLYQKRSSTWSRRIDESDVEH